MLINFNIKSALQTRQSINNSKQFLNITIYNESGIGQGLFHSLLAIKGQYGNLKVQYTPAVYVSTAVKH